MASSNMAERVTYAIYYLKNDVEDLAVTLDRAVNMCQALKDRVLLLEETRQV